MRPKVITSLLLGILCLLCQAAWAQDSQDKFLTAYQAFARGETLEKQKNYPAALQAFKEASQLLNSIATETPNWEPGVVDFRRKRAAEAITRLQPKVGSSGGSVEPLNLPGLEETPGTGGTTAPPSRATGPTKAANLDDVATTIKKFQDDLERIKEERDTLRRQQTELNERLKKAESDVAANEQRVQILKQRADTAEKELLAEKNKRSQDAEKVVFLTNQVKSLQREVREAQVEADSQREDYSQRGNRLTTAGARIQALIKERDRAREEAETARKRADAAEKKSEAAINEVQRKMEGAIKERDALIVKLKKTEEERDVAVKQITQMKEAQKNVDKLVTDNTTLMAKLAAAEKQITQFKADGVQKDQLIADLRTEVTEVKRRLETVQKESAGYQTQMAELQSRLESTSKQLAQVKTDDKASAAERKKMTEENGILRSIVVTQMKKQAARDQTQKLVLQELKKGVVKSQELETKIRFLAEPVLILTPEQKALFKKPQVDISENEIALTATNQEPPAPAPTDPVPPVVVPAPPLPTSTPAPVATNPRSTPVATPAATPGRTASATATPSRTATPTATPEPLAMLDTNKNIKPPPGGELPRTTGPTETRTEPVTTGKVTESSPSVASVPPELQADAQAAKDHFDRGNYRDAERTYEKMLAKAPNNIYALSNLGVVRFKEGKLKLAEEAFRKAVAIAPEDAFSRCTLGIIYYSQSRYDDAVTELTKALAINPKYAAAHNFLGITASQKGWSEAAQKELETAVSLDPNYADAHFNLAVVYATQQPPDKEKARLHYKRAIELGAEADPSLEQLLK